MLDAAAREDVQHTAYHDGNLMQQIGALLLELGRATLSLRMGQSPVSFLHILTAHIFTRVVLSVLSQYEQASSRLSCMICLYSQIGNCSKVGCNVEALLLLCSRASL